MIPIQFFSILFSLIILLSDGIYSMHIKRDVFNGREQRDMNSTPSPISEIAAVPENGCIVALTAAEVIGAIGAAAAVGNLAVGIANAVDKRETGDLSNNLKKRC
jgi:hypothetical protein